MEKFNFDKQPEPRELLLFQKEEVINEILAVIKKRKLTYAYAYESLQAAYEILKYESNFVQVDSQSQFHLPKK